MATKNLARTAVERGRLERYRIERDRIKRARRTEERAHARAVRLDPEAEMPKTGKISKRGNQSENLRPLWSFLNKHIGRNWAKVLSEIKQKFDTRTLQAFHIVVQHLLADIEPHKNCHGYPSGAYYIDNQNRLQKHKNKRRWWSRPSKTEKDIKKEVLNWLNNRAVVHMGYNKYRWFYPTQKATLKWVGRKLVWFQKKHQIETEYIQGPPLTDEEARPLYNSAFFYWSEWMRDEVLSVHQLPKKLLPIDW